VADVKQQILRMVEKIIRRIFVERVVWVSHQRAVVEWCQIAHRTMRLKKRMEVHIS